MRVCVCVCICVACKCLCSFFSLLFSLFSHVFLFYFFHLPYYVQTCRIYFCPPLLQSPLSVHVITIIGLGINAFLNTRSTVRLCWCVRVRVHYDDVAWCLCVRLALPLYGCVCARVCLCAHFPLLCSRDQVSLCVPALLPPRHRTNSAPTAFPCGTRILRYIRCCFSFLFFFSLYLFIFPNSTIFLRHFCCCVELF